MSASLHCSEGAIDVLYWLSLAAMEFVGEGAMGHAFNTIALQQQQVQHPLVGALKAYMSGFVIMSLVVSSPSDV